jgi:hypothetical protein
VVASCDERILSFSLVGIIDESNCLSSLDNHHRSQLIKQSCKLSLLAWFCMYFTDFLKSRRNHSFVFRCRACFVPIGTLFSKREIKRLIKSNSQLWFQPIAFSVTSSFVQPSSNQYCADPELYPRCSYNTGCGCAQDLTNGGQVCTQKPMCSCLQSCSRGAICSQPDTTCVSDSRCPQGPLCFPNALFSSSTCPAPQLYILEATRRKRNAARKNNWTMDSDENSAWLWFESILIKERSS